ncbi:MAG: menaquinone biosynthesis decarboxylase [Bacteroidota bacterium]
MTFPALGEFVRYLESIGELHRVKAEVDPHLEMTEIAVRALKERRPALLFEKVKNSHFPVAMNVLASDRRVELALGKHPERIGEELITFFDRIMPLKLNVLFQNRTIAKRLLNARAKRVKMGIAQEVSEPPDLDALPIQFCWPKDGGRFLTLGQVITEDPLSRMRNVGIYRLQVYDKQRTGMHWQIQKGGGFHYFQAEKLGKPLEVAVALGTDPALLVATVAALPEGIDEVMFASFLRGKRIPMTRGQFISIDVPANAEFVLEGIVPPKERRMEGPYGDHFGHYSHAARFPVFHLKGITRRKSPIYPATIVGKPPMEDKYLGDATQQILGPLIRLVHREVRSLWAYYEAGFHNLLVVSVEERYQKEAMKAALGLMGEGQLSLTKCAVLVSSDIDPKDWQTVLREIRDHFDPHYDFVLIPKVPLDTLDFTSYTMELGSKMVIDATRKQRGRRARDPESEARKRRALQSGISHLKQFDRRIVETNLVEETLLLVKVRKDGRAVVENLVRKKELQALRIIAAVSEDVDLHDPVSQIWGIFTRFDCERDVLFSEQKLPRLPTGTTGISPVYKGILGIDATWKKGYPESLVMTEKITKRVDERWDSYWK